MARLFNQISNDRSQITKMEQLIDATMYDNLVDAAERVCGKTNDGYFERPTLALKLGYELKKYAELLRRDYLTSILKEKEYLAMERFLQVMQFWSEDVAQFAKYNSWQK